MVADRINIQAKRLTSDVLRKAFPLEKILKIIHFFRSVRRCGFIRFRNAFLFIIRKDGIHMFLQVFSGIGIIITHGNHPFCFENMTGYEKYNAETV